MFHSMLEYFCIVSFEIFLTNSPIWLIINTVASTVLLSLQNSSNVYPFVYLEALSIYFFYKNDRIKNIKNEVMIDKEQP